MAIHGFKLERYLSKKLAQPLGSPEEIKCKVCQAAWFAVPAGILFTHFISSAIRKQQRKQRGLDRVLDKRPRPSAPAAVSSARPASPAPSPLPLHHARTTTAFERLRNALAASWTPRPTQHRSAPAPAYD
ncbi:unnamed protein product [Vitrella brassicaformis CCMP3155]|uniref:Uncharacterized protein n=1 Tax=Vitrella brassicaformis (strain CCMP3155) TaxID=1169540 RepID=A0A0G4H2S8_VITBC|nr:unnamed protein product [Vitrella brassicaformis CCMP3155]|mmetsp:Transcript_23610/g.58377  ORF Transcript_23610/g.58377 Transcript_23610/m.58377 type:complete len:130 (-) Transcript_23610:809-1198(-)|eukprot:CEM37981.1 unnamed protein product [Vitrella brassicaformis CCMP3155]